MKRKVTAFLLSMALSSAVIASDAKAVYIELKHVKDINPHAADLVLEINAAKAVHCEEVPHPQNLMMSSEFHSMLTLQMEGEHDKIEQMIKERPCEI